jgi:hypothetical protein
MQQQAGPRIFYDLGSGVGRPVFAAALLYPFDLVVGVELLQVGSQGYTIQADKHTHLQTDRQTMKQTIKQTIKQHRLVVRAPPPPRRLFSSNNQPALVCPIDPYFSCTLHVVHSACQLFVTVITAPAPAPAPAPALDHARHRVCTRSVPASWPTTNSSSPPCCRVAGKGRRWNCGAWCGRVYACVLA